jgi:hypothetical protein
MKKIILLAALLASCQAFEKTPFPAPPTATPTPTPPPPTPTPESKPSVFFGPREVPTKALVTFYLCEPYKPRTELFALLPNETRVSLGFFRDNSASGCMQLDYPGLNTASKGPSDLRWFEANGNLWGIWVQDRKKD